MAQNLPERTLVFDMNYDGSKYYRIPALTVAADKSLIAVVDKRGNSLQDLPNTISIVSRRSTDYGKTWSAPVVVAQGGNGKTYGDPAVVLDKNSGHLLCILSVTRVYGQRLHRIGRVFISQRVWIMGFHGVLLGLLLTRFIKSIPIGMPLLPVLAMHYN